jgi:hypothetical protein
MYAKFVHKILGNNEKCFEKELIPDYKNSEKPDLNFLIQEVYDIYGHLLGNNYSKKKQKNMELKLNNDDDEDEHAIADIDDDILSDPYLMIRKFKELEDKIIRKVQRLENFNKMQIREQQEKTEIIKELKDRIKKLEKEYDFEKSLLIEYKNNELGKNSQDIINKDFYIMADDLCKKIYQTFNSEKNLKKNGNNKNIDTWEINADMTKCINIMVKKEQLINKLMEKIESIEKDDVILFNEIMSKKKLEIKRINQIKIREKLEKNLLDKKFKANEKYKKIIFKIRRPEPSSHLEKKEVKVKIDEKDIKRQENEDLLLYD